MKQIIAGARLERKIYLVRGHKVMLDRDLAELYEVLTKNLNKAVARNLDRFPEDFMFRLTLDEASRFQIGTLKRGHNIKYLPHVFTEQGVAMLSSVLNSKRAALVNIAIMRTFVHLRELILTHKDLTARLDTLEKKYDKQFRVVFDAIRELMDPPVKTRPQIGFKRKEPS